MKAARIALGEGKMKGLMSKATTAVCQTASNTMTTIQGMKVSRRRRFLEVISDSLQGSGSGFPFAADLRDLVPDFVNKIDETGIERCFDRAGAGQVDLVGGDHAARARAHDEDYVGEIGRFPQVVRYQDGGELTSHPDGLKDAPQFFAGKRIESAERFIQH